jgi:MOSC domain-containing protein YiiM
MTPVSGSCVIGVSRSATHTFSKRAATSIRLLAGLGVEGDAHLGRTVKHRSHVARDPTRPNLRQIHLMHAELFDELHRAGYAIAPGDLGENITTAGLALLALPTGARLHVGASAILEVTGLRNPCSQLERFRKGLMAAVLDRDADGNLVRKAGVMAVVTTGGDVMPGDAIRVELPPLPYRPLVPV